VAYQVLCSDFDMSASDAAQVVVASTPDVFLAKWAKVQLFGSSTFNYTFSVELRPGGAVRVFLEAVSMRHFIERNLLTALRGASMSLPHRFPSPRTIASV